MVRGSVNNSKGAAIITIHTALYIDTQVMLLFTRKCYITKINDRFTKICEK